MILKYIFWNDDTGYGTSAKQILKALTSSGIKVIPVGLEHNLKVSSEYQISKSFISSGPYEIVFIHSAPYYIAGLMEPGKINIAYCTWETSVLPRMWVDVLNLCAAVFVPSRFNKTCYEASGVLRPILLLPHISEFKGLAPFRSAPNPRKPRPFSFYTIGMWTNRKNNLALIRAFQKAFKKSDLVQLSIKTSKKDYTQPAFRILRKLGFSYYHNLTYVRAVNAELLRDQRISLYSNEWSSDEIAAFHLKNDCYISLCKSEGWGMGAYEAAWFGKPVVITGYGGQVDFLPDPLATLLPYELVKINERVWTEYNSKGQEWAEVDMDAAIGAMRNVFEHQMEYKKKGQSLQAHVAESFNEKQIIDTFIQNLEQFRSAQ